MSRPSLRRTLNLESLETRQVLSAVVAPTADQQFALELINLVRTNPSAAAAEITSNITPDIQATLNNYGLTVSGLVSKLDSATAQPPLAWNDALASAAQQQSQYEANNGVQTHQGAGEAGVESRINSAGYTNDNSYGENTYAYADSIMEAMQSFLFDWGVSDDGHYTNLMNGSYKDVGVGLVNSNNGVGPLVITQDFGSQNNEGPQILGVVYNDPNSTGQFADGSGQGGVTINAVNQATGQDYQTQTWGAGGYQVPVASNGTYKVTETMNGQVLSSQQVQVGGVNVEVDFDNTPAVTQQAQAAPTPSPSPAPSSPSSTSSQSSSTQQAAPSQPLVLMPQSPSTPTTQDNSSDDSSSLTLSGWGNWTV